MEEVVDENRRNCEQKKAFEEEDGAGRESKSSHIPCVRELKC